MRITTKTTIKRTPSLENYIETKFAPLAKFITHFDNEGETELRLEISRTTRHHRKGEVFFVAADIGLPKRILRAEAYAEDVLTAIDQARDTLRLEIEKYKTQLVKPRRTARK